MVLRPLPRGGLPHVTFEARRPSELAPLRTDIAQGIAAGTIVAGSNLLAAGQTLRTPSTTYTPAKGRSVTTNWSRGILTSTFFKLCSRAPRTSMNFCSAMTTPGNRVRDKASASSLQSENVNEV